MNYDKIISTILQSTEKYTELITKARALVDKVVAHSSQNLVDESTNLPDISEDCREIKTALQEFGWSIPESENDIDFYQNFVLILAKK